jgi:hypothetical protein
MRLREALRFTEPRRQLLCRARVVERARKERTTQRQASMWSETEALVTVRGGEGRHGIAKRHACGPVGSHGRIDVTAGRPARARAHSP